MSASRLPTRSTTGSTPPVGTFPLGATPNGLLDMAGNVAEWADSPSCKRAGEISKPKAWNDHYVNEEPGGRVVDYDQGMVFDNRQQRATAMFENPAVNYQKDFF